MASLKNFIPTKTFRFYCIRMLLLAGILVFYLFLWRPARIIITEQLVFPQVASLETSESTFQSSLKGGAIEVTYFHSRDSKELHYRPQFGFFLLVALVPLIFMTAHPKPYWLLGGIHLAGSVFAYLGLMIGVLGLQWGFMLVDVINGYLVPGLSLAMVPLAMNGMIFKKERD